MGSRKGGDVNRTRIDWTDHTWNPITGCLRGCDYCYARRMAHRLRGRYGYPMVHPFRPILHFDRLFDPHYLTTPSRIFTVSMGDMFGPGVEPWWVLEIFHRMVESRQHTYQILTKYPEKILGMVPEIIPPNVWLGTTITQQKDEGRLDAITTDELRYRGATVVWASFEPLHGEFVNCLKGLDWIVIGAETGTRKDRIEPDPEWIRMLIDEADVHGIPVFMKNNLRPYWAGTLRREFPEGVL